MKQVSAKTWRRTAVGVVVLLGIGILVLMNFTNFSAARNGRVVYHYGEQNINAVLEKEDLDKIIRLFNGKFLYTDAPSCGHSADNSIILNGEITLCPMADGCATVYWKERNRFFSLSEEEGASLKGLLAPYGFSFPFV